MVLPAGTTLTFTRCVVAEGVRTGNNKDNWLSVSLVSLRSRNADLAVRFTLTSTKVPGPNRVAQVKPGNSGTVVLLMILAWRGMPQRTQR